MKENSEPRLFTAKNKNFEDLTDTRAIIIFIVLTVILLFGISLLPKSPLPLPVPVSVPAALVTTAQ